jgi:two-component system NtrC family sensor kinase
MVSAERLTQVFVNLFLNAADAMNGHGKISIHCEAGEKNVRVVIRDEGPGIKPDLARKIFDPFFTTKDPGKGTGLGLSISRSIVETYGGSLELEALDQDGATFVVTLPRANAD